MGAISSGSTVEARAYLTELGRKYLFQDENHPRFVTLTNGTKVDRLKIERFSLGDPDINYTLPDKLVSGQIPDLSGENEGSITGAKGRTLNNLISPFESGLAGSDDTVEYSTSEGNIVFDLNKQLSNIPTVVTQQLLTLINEESTLETNYELLPKNYGENTVKNNELIIELRKATRERPGYRMKIIYPTAGGDFDKTTIQFEKGTMQNTTRQEFQEEVQVLDERQEERTQEARQALRNTNI
jgi:hypothetical protein